MPYIKQEDRDRLDAEVKLSVSVHELGWTLANAGEINYVITKMLVAYLNKVGYNYANMNEVIGALECCKLEFYERVVKNYERLKASENGDVY